MTRTRHDRLAEKAMSIGLIPPNEFNTGHYNFQRLSVVGKRKSNKSGAFTMIGEDGYYMINHTTGLTVTGTLSERGEAYKPEVDYNGLRLWFNALPKADLNHEYIVRKKVTIDTRTAKSNGNELILGLINVSSVGERALDNYSKYIRTAQRITNSFKCYMRGFPGKDMVYPIGFMGHETNSIIVCEGFATGQSIWDYECGQVDVVCAMNSGAMNSIYWQLESKFSDKDIYIAPDYDHTIKETTKGIKKTRILLPPLKEEQLNKGLTDWNDYFVGENII